MSGGALYWEGLKHCKPVLASGVIMQHRQIRGEPWLLVVNNVTGEHLRLNNLGATLIEQFDGEQTLESLLHTTEVNEVEFINWLGPLCSAGLITLGLQSEDERLIQQQLRDKSTGLKQFLNPLALRIPLHNPDSWLQKVITYASWVFSTRFLVLLLVLLLSACITAFLSFDAIVMETKRIAQAPQHWWLYGLMFPFLKLFHEFAHAITVKRWGGAVHEFGIAFLVLLPVPYIDASDAWQFAERQKRVLVSAAGMLAEGALAALALLIWVNVEPGLFRDMAFAAFILGSLTTLFFNANPLLKFDGYYILQDWLDMPNLASRSTQYFQYLAKRYVLRIDNSLSPVSADGEQKWLLVYGASATLYRCFITLVIAFYLAGNYFFIGVLLGLFGITQFFIKPLWAGVHFIRSAPELDGRRHQTVFYCTGIAVLLLMFFSFAPLPSSTRTEGIVWVPKQAQLFAAREGVIDTLLVEPGAKVERGQLLMRLHAPEIQTQKEVIAAKIAAALVEAQAETQVNPSVAQSIRADIHVLRTELAEIERQIAQLDIRAEVEGTFALDTDMGVEGQHVKQGQRVAYIVNAEQLVVRAVLPQQRIDRLQTGVTGAQVRLAHRFKESMPATLTRQTPAASNDLPSPALAYDGRRGIAVASESENGLKTVERVFHIELALPEQVRVAGIGGRAYVTLQHQPESIGKRWWRSTRQIFLKHLTV